MMITSRTPLRASFLGGGSDMASFYETAGPGRVISAGLNRHLYVTVKPHPRIFGERYRISYSQTEVVQNRSEIQNNIIRACLEFMKVDEPLYISTISDIPAASGLGSSSALAVGLLNCLYHLRGERISKARLAETACKVEIDLLGQPIGKQDQYACAFGGLNFFEFQKNGGDVLVMAPYLDADVYHMMRDSFSLFWTGLTRNVETVLDEQNKKFKSGNVDEVSAVRDMVDEFVTALQQGKDARYLAEMIDKSWELKKRFSSNINNSHIDELYMRAKAAGAYGGKIAGGGGGGFLLLGHAAGARDHITKACGFEYSIPIDIDPRGTELIYGS